MGEEKYDGVEHCHKKEDTKLVFHINNFHGHTENVNIQQGTYKSSQNNSGRIEVGETIIKEKISYSKLFQNKLREVMFAGLVFFISAVYQMNHKVDLQEMFSQTDGIVLLLFMKILFPICLVLVVIFLCDMIKILRLRKKGMSVELQSKIELIRSLLDVFENEKNGYSRDIRAVGPYYKNIDGEIYRIKEKKCPLCETEPIGRMFLVYSNRSKKYLWRCSQNHSHKIEFDYKKKM